MENKNVVDRVLGFIEKFGFATLLVLIGAAIGLLCVYAGVKKGIDDNKSVFVLVVGVIVFATSCGIYILYFFKYKKGKAYGTEDVLKKYTKTDLTYLRNLIDTKVKEKKNTVLNTATFFLPIHSDNSVASIESFADYCDDKTLKGELTQHIVKFINNSFDAVRMLDLVDKLCTWERAAGKPLRYIIKVYLDRNLNSIPFQSSLLLYSPYHMNFSYFVSQKGQRYYVDVPINDEQDVAEADELWNGIWSHENLLELYNGFAQNNPGLRHNVKNEIQKYKIWVEKETRTNRKWLTDIVPKFVDEKILGNIYVESVLLFGSSAKDEDWIPNDIDLVFVIREKFDTVRDMFRLDVIINLAEKEGFNVRINGISAYRHQHGKCTIDFCLDSLNFINGNDVISTIDIAASKRVILMGQDPYDRLSRLPISYAMRLERVKKSEDYINNNLDVIEVADDKLIIIKQIEFALMHFLDIDTFDPENIYVKVREHWPSFVPLIERLHFYLGFWYLIEFHEIKTFALDVFRAIQESRTNE